MRIQEQSSGDTNRWQRLIEALKMTAVGAVEISAYEQPTIRPRPGDFNLKVNNFFLSILILPLCVCSKNMYI